MLSLFRTLADRLKAMFATSAALELESEFLARDAERQAELLRQAERYDGEGLHGLAGHLRQQAENLSFHKPLAAVLPAVAHLQGTLPDNAELAPGGEPRLPGLEAPGSPKALPAPRKKGGKS